MAGTTKFYGSQVGGQSVINHVYTDYPWRLFAYDIYNFFFFAWSLPWILLPIQPCDSGDLDELAFTRENLFCVFIHFVLCIMQLSFILVLPFTLLLPIWLVAAGMIVFFTVNSLLCMLLNGGTLEYRSDEKYAPALPEHAHEQWIFLNGVAVGYVSPRISELGGG